MKITGEKIFALLLCLFTFYALCGAEKISKYISLHVPGSLINETSKEEKEIITHLIVSGNINQKDFEAINKEFKALTYVDLRNAKYFEYSNNSEENLYVSHTGKRIIPEMAFGCDTSTQKNSESNQIDTLYLPLTTDGIGENFSQGRTHPLVLIIPSNVSEIEPEAFNGFFGSFVVDPNNEKFTSKDGILYDKLMKRLIRCPQSKTGKINIASTVISIDEMAFKDCKGITYINLPFSIKKIGEYAFENCTSIETIIIPEGVKYLKWGTFDNCSGLKSVLFPNSLLAIEGFAFSDCNNLTSITLPESLYGIGVLAFADCSGIETIYIPSTLTNIDIDAFDRAGGYFYVDDKNPVYSASDGILFDKARTTLFKCSVNREGEYFIPQSIRTIAEDAFKKCEKLSRIVVHSEVNDINGCAFYNCSADVIIDSGNYWFSFKDGRLINNMIDQLVPCPSPDKSYNLSFTPDD